MTARRKILPSVLLLILSSLGILMGCLFAGLTLSGTNLFFSQNNSSVDPLPLISTAAMGITTAILNVPTLITTIKKLFGKRQKKPPQSLQSLRYEKSSNTYTVKGLFLPPGNTVYVKVKEGYSVENVADKIRKKYPDLRIVICADNDQNIKSNPGVTKAKKAAM